MQDLTTVYAGWEGDGGKHANIWLLWDWANPNVWIIWLISLVNCNPEISV